MADFTVSVTKNGLVPAVIYAGGEGAAGKTVTFAFSEDWNGFTKEILFYDMRGNLIVTPCISGQEIPIPDELAMYGGHHKFTVRGFTLDDKDYINDSLQVTGTIVTTYTAGHNPRLEGKLLPSTLDLFLARAENAMHTYLEQAKASGEFDGEDGRPGKNGDDGTSAGFGTPTATVIYLPQSAQPYVLVSASGADAEKVFSFEFGIPASMVEDLRILGHYTSLSALQAAVPNPEVGDAYSVGSTTPYNIYIYDGVAGTWANYGAIGGGGGSSVVVDTAMSSSSTNAVQNKIIKAYVDNSIPTVPTALKNPYAVSIYGQSYDGSSAVTVSADSSMSSSSQKPVQNKVVKQYIDDALGDIQTAVDTINAVIGNVAANNTTNEIESEGETE